jgi:hypothetical protein
MPQREVRLPLSELDAYAHLNPTSEEDEAFYACIEDLAHGAEGDPLPFGDSSGYPNCNLVECGRFLVVYEPSAELVNILAILSSSRFE